MTLLDVGQGDGIIFTSSKGECVTIDVGSSSREDIGERVLIPYLEYMGIEKISYGIITHLDDDHYNGVLDILEETHSSIKIEKLILSEKMCSIADEEKMKKLKQLANNNGVEIQYIKCGDEIHIGDMKLICISPKEDEDYENINDSSLVFEVITNAGKGILTGDISMEQELKIRNSLREEKYDFLKVAHHGSKYSTSDAFIETIQPDYAFISAGRKNRYGHPHKETIQRLENHAVQYFVTKEEGEITVSFDSTMKIETFCKHHGKEKK